MLLLNDLKKECYFQIGTNNGNDNFQKYVFHYKPKRVILVEPNPLLINQINENYKEIKKFCEVIIINKTIYTEDDKDVSLFFTS